MSIFITRNTPFRLRCDRCGALSCLHMFDVEHARKQMMEMEKGPWRCLPVQKGQKATDKLIEDVCDACVKEEEKKEAERVAALLAEAERAKEIGSADRKVRA